MKIILGINGGTRPGNQDSSASIIKNGKIVACIEEERFIKIKHAPGLLPENSIRFCLQEAKISIKDVDYVVFAGATYDNMKQILSNFFNLKFRYCPKIYLIDHHLAHASSAFYTSGFENSFIITADLSGDSKSTVLFYANKTGIKEIKSYSKPNSLGLFYATITQYLGFRYDNDECKTMALAGFKSKTNCIINDFLKVKNNEYFINTKYLVDGIMPGKTNPSRQEPLFSKYFTDKLKNKARFENEKIKEFYLSVAKTAQEQLEQSYFALIKQLKNSKYKSNNLCLVGGVSLNAQLNSKIAYSNEFDNIFIPPCAGDTGLSLGGALYVANKYKSLYPTRLKSAYLGQKFSNKEIKNELDRLKLKYKYIDNIQEVIAKKLAENKIGAVFQGKMEYGPRALGARSILANPKNKKIKDILNKEFKQRERFQPFAPAVLNGKEQDYFDLPKTKADYNFMIINAKVKKERKKDIISAIHVDDTARVQIVDKKTNPYFYKIIEIFGKITNVNVLLNTSLNKRGLPIARTPNDALNVFFTTPMDFIALENYLVEK
jgi:carbamoyltransferase